MQWYDLSYTTRNNSESMNILLTFTILKSYFKLLSIINTVTTYIFIFLCNAMLIAVNVLYNKQ